MKNLFKFILWLISLIYIFYINNIYLITFLFIISCYSIIKLKGILFFKSEILIFFPMVLLIIILNGVLENYIIGIMIGVRFYIACFLTAIFTTFMSIKNISNAIGLMLSPLRIFKINTNDIELLISISISIIPIMINEFNQKYLSLKSKTCKVTYKNIILLIKKMLIEIIIKTKNYEDVIISKGYN